MSYYSKEQFIKQIEGIKNPIYINDYYIDSIINGFKTGIYDIKEKIFTGKSKKAIIIKTICKSPYNILIIECRSRFNINDILDKNTNLDNIWIGKVEKQSILLSGLRYSIPEFINKTKIKFLIFNNFDLLMLTKEFIYEIDYLIHKLTWEKKLIVIILKTCPLYTNTIKDKMQKDYTFIMESYEEGGGDIFYEV